MKKHDHACFVCCREWECTKTHCRDRFSVQCPECADQELAERLAVGYSSPVEKEGAEHLANNASEISKILRVRHKLADYWEYLLSPSFVLCYFWFIGYSSPSKNFAEKYIFSTTRDMVEAGVIWGLIGGLFRILVVALVLLAPLMFGAVIYMLSPGKVGRTIFLLGVAPFIAVLTVPFTAWVGFFWEPLTLPGAIIGLCIGACAPFHWMKE